MSAQAQPKFALRPYLPHDADVLAEIFRASITALAEDDYSATQRQAWAAVANDEAAFAARLARHLTLIATFEGAPVGFISLAENRNIDLLYVHPAAAGQGIGAMLVDAVEKLAAARGAPHITVDASDTAREFFQRRGFTSEQRNSVSVGGEWLANTTMKKTLPAKGATP